MKEIWKDIVGYEGLYQVSSLGRVKSFYLYKGTSERILVPLKDKDGYNLVNIHKNKKHKTARVHRLVAKAFIPNPESKLCVNHKNSVRTDNYCKNLEWCTHSENNKHAFALGNQKPNFAMKGRLGVLHPKSMAVVMIEINLAIKDFGSIAEASRITGIDAAGISKCALGKRKTSGGFKWKYKKDYENGK